MKIAIWLDDTYDPKVGGGFSYYDKLVKSIDTYTFNSLLDICFVTESSKDMPTISRPIIRLSYHISPEYKLTLSKIPIVGKYFKHHFFKDEYFQKHNTYIQQLLTNHIQIIYYLQPTCQIPNFPFIITNWDIGHLSTFAFPELVMNGEFDHRSYYYSNIMPQALMIFCESVAGKEELIKYTHINEQRIRVVPIFAGECSSLLVDTQTQMSTLKSYGLTKNQYFFYPAQFWAHKNHITLINAFQQFHTEYSEYKLILTGSDKGNLQYILDVTKKLNLGDSVIFAGFVSNETIYTLYKNATALTMSSYFGPTNMPPLEALTLGCPIICTNIPGHKEM